MAQFHWNPETYLALMREEVPEYERLQEETAVATGENAGRLLELGTGTGQTAMRVLRRHPDAFLVGIDSSGEMLRRARAVLPVEHVQLLVARIEAPLPAGPFDLAFSALAVHHLDGPGKADLFGRVARVLSPGGRFVLGDVVVPERAEDAVTPIDGDYDTPSSSAEQLRWLEAAGFRATLVWSRRDLAVLVGVADRVER